VNPQGFRWVRLSLRLAVYARDGWTCLWCLRPVSWAPGRGRWSDCRPAAASLDHLRPKSAGGQNHHGNLVTLCVGCNARKRDLPPDASLPADVHDRCLAAVASPVDRRLGCLLAEELCPRWVERERESARRRRGAARSPSP
jgi:hypothetical protein